MNYDEKVNTMSHSFRYLILQEPCNPDDLTLTMLCPPRLSSYPSSPSFIFKSFEECVCPGKSQ